MMSVGYVKHFDREKYNYIKAALLNYRLDPFIRDREAAEGVNKGLIFPFARGLRFSALLIYAIREVLSTTNFDASWGQIIGDDDSLALSGECDIIIHKKGYYHRWNGNGGGQHIMDFRFIERKNAVAVISCKSYLTKSAIEKPYCENLLSYVTKVWLFAECCGPDSVELIDTAAKEIGYEHFWYMYTWSRANGVIDDSKDVDVWQHFIETIKQLIPE